MGLKASAALALVSQRSSKFPEKKALRGRMGRTKGLPRGSLYGWGSDSQPDKGWSPRGPLLWGWVCLVSTDCVHRSHSTSVHHCTIGAEGVTSIKTTAPPVVYLVGVFLLGPPILASKDLEICSVLPTKTLAKALRSHPRASQRDLAMSSVISFSSVYLVRVLRVSK